MATSLTSTGITFPDSTTQTTAASASSYVGGKGQVFTTSGTFTVPTGVSAVKVTVVGGGGGGGGGNANMSVGVGGAGGGVAIKYLTGLTPGATVTVTIGAAGTTGSGAAGGAGGTSSFGAYCSATGGAGGGIGQYASNSVSDSNGGVGSNGDINITGGYGASGGWVVYGCGNFLGIGGAGGGSFGNADLLGANRWQANGLFNGPRYYSGGPGIFGGSGGRGFAALLSFAGNAATGYGNGGGGAYGQNGNYVGGAATAGIVVVEW